MAAPRTIESKNLALAGVTARRIDRHDDQRGSQIEAHSINPAATGLVNGKILLFRSRSGVMRGVYVHPLSDVHLSLVEGRAILGLHDLRPASATYGRSLTIDIGPDHPVASVRVPAGVAYGLWITTDAMHALTAVRTIGEVDEFACRFDDPGLGIRWPKAEPMLSTRDALAGSLNALRSSVASLLG